MEPNDSGITPDKRFVSDVCSNTQSDLIYITEDKLENILLKHINNLNKSNGWITPTTLFITILIVLITSDFKDTLGLEKYVWNALFIIGLIISIIWLIISIIKAGKSIKRATIEFLISEIKNKQK
jgi:hypothetical protein